MRLLDTTTKQLRTFYGKKIPQYAILSHMWGREKDEVVFKHITGSHADKCEGKKRKGYAKLEKACKQAVKDGWKYIWIDTCCIDKTSSAELSEAINSMYEWYQNSGVCYVYLEDVQSDGEVDSEEKYHGDKDWGDNDDEDWGNDSDEDDGEEEVSDEDMELMTFPIVPFERSRWFKRGWTLQELIAPQFVVFYSKDWTDIGTKASLRETISAVTRIRVEMLMDYLPSKASVAEKISWAAFRKTTRVEDTAYCLMGLLGVNMPLLYGEGERAFRRLQEEFMKVSDDDSLFAWKGRFNGDNRGGDVTCGMLATSPWDFRDGMNIEPSDDGAHSPYSMTNQGLKIKLPLLPIDPKRELIGRNSKNIFKTILKCVVRGTFKRIVIYLEMIRGQSYQRIFPHWLDEMEMPPNVTGLTSLFVPQTTNIFATTHDRRGINGVTIEILPTKSGFTVDGHSLIQGHKRSARDRYPYREVITFKHQEKSFGVAIGQVWGVGRVDNPWLFLIDVVNEKQSYGDPYYYGGSGSHLQRGQHLDRLSEKIPGMDWWVTISLKRTAHDVKNTLLAIIHIQREPIQAKGWYIPSAISTSDSWFPGNFLLNYHNVYSNFKKEAHDWVAVFNSKVERKFEVNQVHTLLHKSKIYCVQFSCDGKYLATGGQGDRVQVYDMEAGAEICTFINKSTESIIDIHSICFSPDSKFIAAGDSKGCIKILDIDAKRVHKVLNGHQKTIKSLRFSPNGHTLISGSEDSETVRIWQIADGTSTTPTIPPDHDHSTGIESIAISPNGSLLATGGQSGIIRIWDAVTTQLLEEFPERGDSVHVVFTPDGEGLVSGSTGGVLRYWDVGGLLHTGVKRKLDDLSDSGASSALARRNVGKINKPTMASSLTGYTITSVAVSHDGRWAISRLKYCYLVFWDLNDATFQLILETPLSFQKPLLGTSPVGDVFATADDDVVRVWRYDNIEPQGRTSSHFSA